jgi:hypothetical protein
MGINLEHVELLSELAREGKLRGGKVLELGLQDMFIPNEKLSKVLNTELSILKPSDLFSFFGYEDHKSIDGQTKNPTCYPLDLNNIVDSKVVAELKSDLVTNFGTSEHVFNQMNVFRNIHEFCAKDGVMIHCVTTLGNVQHGYFNYQPRMFYELALANNYEILAMYITSDYRPILIPYSQRNLYKNRFKDVLFLVVFRKASDASFVVPFDGMFGNQARVFGYSEGTSHTEDFSKQFESFLVSGDWINLNNSRQEVFLKRTKSQLSRFGVRTRFKEFFNRKVE